MENLYLEALNVRDYDEKFGPVPKLIAETRKITLELLSLKAENPNKVESKDTGELMDKIHNMET
jgi:hypothetical protein